MRKICTFGCSFFLCISLNVFTKCETAEAANRTACSRGRLSFHGNCYYRSDASMSLTDFISSVIGDDAELASFSSTDELDDFLAVISGKMLHQLFEHSPSIRVGLLYEPADDILLALSRNQSGACGLVPIGNLSELTRHSVSNAAGPCAFLLKAADDGKPALGFGNCSVPRPSLIMEPDFITAQASERSSCNQYDLLQRIRLLEETGVFNSVGKILQSKSSRWENAALYGSIITLLPIFVLLILLFVKWVILTYFFDYLPNSVQKLWFIRTAGGNILGGYAVVKPSKSEVSGVRIV
ncbi:hypothetical protein BOX15_Mlig009049g1 [Macrostomum lignano]|uniref:Uncharacterized protein n=1 Tax=Macrostomum lignano TaxID=282301 RepID=A0A267GKR9_9PLAT|nr:hypothetical protein BOX15_Mlig009049g1 [Macrostomum lignano]